MDILPLLFPAHDVRTQLNGKRRGQINSRVACAFGRFRSGDVATANVERL
jgi:hypothetical protein